MRSSKRLGFELAFGGALPNAQTIVKIKAASECLEMVPVPLPPTAILTLVIGRLSSYFSKQELWYEILSRFRAISRSIFCMGRKMVISTCCLVNQVSETVYLLVTSHLDGDNPVNNTGGWWNTGWMSPFDLWVSRSWRNRGGWNVSVCWPCNGTASTKWTTPQISWCTLKAVLNWL